MSRGYRAFVTITGDDGRRMGAVGLRAVADNINGYVRALEDPYARPAWEVGTRLGKTVLRLDAEDAHEARVNWAEGLAFLKRSGWPFTTDLNANTSRALYGAPRRRSADRGWLV